MAPNAPGGMVRREAVVPGDDIGRRSAGDGRNEVLRVRPFLQDVNGDPGILGFKLVRIDTRSRPP